MKSVLFFDPVCPQPYDSRSLLERALPGTEATVTRIADGLEAWVVQHNRTRPWGRYRPPERAVGIEHVVVLRDPWALSRVRTLYPGARVHLWLHDRLAPRSSRGRRLAQSAGLLRELAPTMICVSNWQRQQVEAVLRWIGLQDSLRTVRIYNPIDDALVPDASPVDEHKLVFFSSPNKGLDYAIDVFGALRGAMPDLRLVVGNPGYKTGALGCAEGVHVLGPQPQARIHEQVRSALCTFHPNFRIPETFGLVFAESQALGTPVLTHECGAALEVLGDREQVLPVTAGQRGYAQVAGVLGPRARRVSARLMSRLGLFDMYIERIRAWRAGARPRVQPDPRFRLTAIVQQWRAFLEGGAGP